MLCEVIAYILSRQRLSAKTFVAGYFFMLCRIDCLCGCCATPPVSEASLSTSPRVRPSGITRGYAWCVPSGDSGCGLGDFPFFSLSTSPRVRPSGITCGYAWCVPRWGQWVRAGRFLFSLPLHFSTSPLLHGFTLRASPAVTHGVSPPGTVGAALIIKSLYSLRG